MGARTIIGGVLRGVVKHAVAACVLVAATAALVTLIFVVLLALALLLNGPLGSPLAAPFWILVSIVAAALASAAVLGPVTAGSEALCRRLGYSHVLLQILVTTLLLFFEVITLGLVVALVRHEPALGGVTGGAVAGAALLLPLGLYWSALKATGWLLPRGRVLWARLRGKDAL